MIMYYCLNPADALEINEASKKMDISFVQEFRTIR